MSITDDNIKHGSFLTQTGRPPWYNTEGESFQSYLIGISGGSASGKTSVAQMLIKNLNIPWVVVISMDSFYRALNAEEKKEVAAGNYDFDHPKAFDFGLLKDTLLKIKSGKKVDIPIYCFKTHSRTSQSTPIYGANIIIFEGILAFHDPRIVELMDLKIFVDTASDIRLARRLKRDIVERGRDPEGVLVQYNRFVKPGYDEYIQPTIKKADLIIPRGLDNVIAIDMVSRFTKQRLEELPMRFRWHLAQSNVHSDDLPANLIVLKQTKQLKCIHTILRDEKCPRDEFIFYTQRLTNLIVELALAHLPIESIEVETSVGEKFQGTQFTSPVCGITVLRAGGCMEPTLRKVCKDCPIGKILIQSDSSTGEPELHYCKLPNDMKDYSVFLMDATIATGAAAIMAIKVLLDHDVKEEQIIFLSYLATPQGVHSICKAFPKVRIITSMVDPGLKANTCFIEPGIGNYGDRYFGTED